MLKLLQEFLEVVFLGVAMKSLLVADGVWLRQTTDQTRVPTQKVPNSRSDRWIMLKFLQEFSEAAFLGVAMKSLPDTASILSGLTIDLTRVSDQQVHNS